MKEVLDWNTCPVLTICQLVTANLDFCVNHFLIVLEILFHFYAEWDHSWEIIKPCLKGTVATKTPVGIAYSRKGTSVVGKLKKRDVVSWRYVTRLGRKWRVCSRMYLDLCLFLHVIRPSNSMSIMGFPKDEIKSQQQTRQSQHSVLN